MKRDIVAEKALEVALGLTAWWHGEGLEHENLREVMAEVSALADGKAREPSEPALKIYGVIRAGSKGTAEQVREFVGLIAEALAHIEVVGEAEPC